MCLEDCFSCQEPCWDIGSDPGPSVSRADTFLHTHAIPLPGIRNSNDGSKPADSRPPDQAGNLCHLISETAGKHVGNEPLRKVSCDVQSAGIMRQGKRHVALPGEMPGDDYKIPWRPEDD